MTSQAVGILPFVRSSVHPFATTDYMGRHRAQKFCHAGCLEWFQAIQMGNPGLDIILTNETLVTIQTG